MPDTMMLIKCKSMLCNVVHVAYCNHGCIIRTLFYFAYNSITLDMGPIKIASPLYDVSGLVFRRILCHVIDVYNMRWGGGLASSFSDGPWMGPSPPLLPRPLRKTQRLQAQLFRPPSPLANFVCNCPRLPVAG